MEDNESEGSKYLCIEDLITEDQTFYKAGEDTISENVYYYLQPNEREHFKEV